MIVNIIQVIQQTKQQNNSKISRQIQMSYSQPHPQTPMLEHFQQQSSHTCSETFLEIAELLKVTLIGPTTYQIRQAQQLLQMMHSDNFIIQLMKVTAQKEIPYNIRKAAILYTITYCKNIQSIKSSHKQIPKQERITNVTKFLFSSLFQNTIEISLRKHLISTLTYLIGLDKNSRLKCMLYQQCLVTLQEMTSFIQFFDTNLEMGTSITNNQNYGNLIDRIVHIGLGIQTVLTVSIHNTKQLIQFVKKSFAAFIQVGAKLYQISSQIISSSNTSKNKAKRDNILQMLSTTKLYSSSLKNYLKKITYSDIQTVKLLFDPIFIDYLNGYLWQFILPGNSVFTNLIFYSRSSNNDLQLYQQFHSIKADFLQILGYTMRCVFQYFRDPIIVSSHKIINSKKLVSQLVQNLYNFNLVCGHSSVKSPSLIKLLEQIMNCLILAVKSNYFYDLLSQSNIKKHLIQGCIFKYLEFAEFDYEKMVGDPEQLINQILQIVDMDPTEYINSRKKQNDIVEAYGEEDELQDHTTLRTVAATLLNHYCKNIEGVLNQILTHIFKEIRVNININIESMGKQGYLHDSKRQQSKALYMIVLGILRDVICDSNNIKLSCLSKSHSNMASQIIELLVDRLSEQSIPQVNNLISTSSNIQQKIRIQNMDYMMLLICIHKYLSKIKNKSLYNSKGNECPSVQALHRAIPIVYRRVCKTLECGSTEVEVVHKIISYDMLPCIVSFSPIFNRSLNLNHIQSQYCTNFISIINHLLSTSNNRQKMSQNIDDEIGMENVQMLNVVYDIPSQNKNTQYSHNQNRQQLTDKKLQTLYNLYKLNSAEIFGNSINSGSKGVSSICHTVSVLASLLKQQIRRDELEQKSIMTKCWNILNEIAQNEIFINIQVIKQNLLNMLIEFVEIATKGMHSQSESHSNYDQFTQNIVKCFNSILQYTNSSQSYEYNEYAMVFSIIPKLFRSNRGSTMSRDKYGFGDLFQSLKLLIVNCKQVIIEKEQQLIKTIVQMCLLNVVNYDANPGKIQHCEGLLILQLLIINCHSAFDSQIWHVLAKELVKILAIFKVQPKSTMENINEQQQGGNKNRSGQRPIIMTNIMTCLALVLSHGFHTFVEDDRALLLDQVVNNKMEEYEMNKIYQFKTMMTNYETRYPYKIIVITLGDLFLSYFQYFLDFYVSNSCYINNKLAQYVGNILNTMLSMIQLHTHDTDNYDRQQGSFGNMKSQNNYNTSHNLYKMGDRNHKGSRKDRQIDLQSQISKQYQQCIQCINKNSSKPNIINHIHKIDQIWYIKQKINLIKISIAKQQYDQEPNKLQTMEIEPQGQPRRPMHSKANQTYTQHKGIWNLIVQYLNQENKAYLKKLMGIVKVNNQNRYIYKIKRAI